MTYQPKGSMCIACTNYDAAKCAALPFKTMPVIDSYVDDTGVVYIVKCVDFKRESGGGDG